MNVRVENLVRIGAIAATAFALLLPASPGVFSAGGEGCTQALEDGAMCDGTGASVCDAGAKQCGSGSTLSSCSDGGGSEVNCTGTTHCATPEGGNPHHPLSNSTGC